MCRWCASELITELEGLAVGPYVQGVHEPGWAGDLIDVMARLSRSGLATGVSSRPASTPLPFHEAASSLLWTLRNTLSVWCGAIAVANPGRSKAAGGIADLALWLARDVVQLERHPEIAMLHSEVMWVIGQVKRMIDIAPTRVYLGDCGASVDGQECHQALYVLPGRRMARCRACGEVYDVVARRGYLLDLAQDQVAPAAEIARALSILGQPVRVERIRQWVRRGKIIQYAAHPADVRHRPRYRVGDVVMLLVPGVVSLPVSDVHSNGALVAA